MCDLYISPVLIPIVYRFRILAIQATCHFYFEIEGNKIKQAVL